MDYQRYSRKTEPIYQSSCTRTSSFGFAVNNCALANYNNILQQKYNSTVFSRRAGIIDDPYSKHLILSSYEDDYGFLNSPQLAGMIGSISGLGTVIGLISAILK